MEGYATHRSVMATSPTPPDASANDPVYSASIFRSARDINRHVFASRTISPFSSPKKRSRSQYEDHSVQIHAEDDDVEMYDATIASPCLEYSGESKTRRIKPLRQTKCPSTVANHHIETHRSPHLNKNYPMPEVDSVDPKNDPFLL
jgi:hypothetical protein